MKIRNLLFAVLAVLLLASPAMAAEVGTVAGAGIGEEFSSGIAFNMGYIGVRTKTFENGTSIWTTMNYGQYVQEHIDALGASLILASPWWKAKSLDALVKDISILFDFGFLSKIRDAGDGDRAIGFGVGAGLDFRLTSVIHVQLNGKAYNTGPDLKLKTIGLITISAATDFLVGTK